MTQSHVNFKRFAISLLGLAVAIMLMWIGWSGGRARSFTQKWGSKDESAKLLVSGASMAPTLRGPSHDARCNLCDLRWVVDQAAGDLSPDRLLCSHCGGTLDLLDPVEPHRNGADIVEIRRLSAAQPIRRGDLVAIKPKDSEPFIKRVIGMSGDTIDIDSELHLLLNGERVEDVLVNQSGIESLPRFLVDRDQSRVVSRWTSTDGMWARDESRRWTCRDQNTSTWLVYSHQSVYDKNQPGPVLDDYQYNVTAARKLQPVDRFSLSGHLECVGTASIEIAFWSPGRSVLATLDIAGGQDFEVTIYEAAAADDLPVSETQPVAIRVQGRSVVLSSLVIKRLVQYRLRAADDRSRYPLKIGPRQLFVLGDNVPISIDSRDFGLVSTDDVEGTFVGQ